MVQPPKPTYTRRTKTHPLDQDRNFDDMAKRFKRNVYDRLKGGIRLAVLRRDFEAFMPELFHPSRPFKVLDAGGGQGQFSLMLAALGHEVVVCDVSAEMLKLAQEQCEAEGLSTKVTFVHGSIQDYVPQHPQAFDLILCHAVLEWIVEPEALLNHLLTGLKPGGWLSLSYYNINSIKMKNLLRGNFQKVIEDDYTGYRGSLTPTFPRDPEDVNRWLEQLPLKTACRSGIRCFHDYLLDPELRDANPEEQMTLELRFSQQEPWRSLSRYIHVLSKKSLA